MFEIKDLKASIEEKDILNGLSLTIKPGEIHAIMGPNGSGKSTLAKVISGHPDFEDPEGDIKLDGKDILDLEPDERANEGVFLAFQYPVDIPGVNNSEFLRMAYNAKQKYQNQPEIDPFDFESLIKEKLTVLNMKEAFLSRPVNHGFSGGEKKRNEILQMLMLDPRVVILDETDSGLDIDSLKQVSDAINHFKSENKMILIITHYQRLLNHIVPDTVHIMADGKITKSGDKSLALTLEDQGYDAFKDNQS
ncbi:Fe-S cluster assembly ATPase SufC [bacterium]|nr:Fe-S cluster assembly ATPase SufC [bacterium]